MSANTDWFHDAKWGAFIHYLADTASAPSGVDLPVDDWNARIDGVDVDTLAAQLAEAGAGYCFLTLGQNSGFFLSPNDTYDDLVGRTPSRLSRRDLVAELAAALAPRGIPMMVYLPAHAPAYDPLAVRGLKCTPPWDASKWQLRPGAYLIEGDIDDRLTAFQRNWEAVVREWSTRWGESVRGWWIDGCYHADTMYRHDDEPNFRSFAAAMKAGNPASIVAFNGGVKVPVERWGGEADDYTAGEISGRLPVLGREPAVLPVHRYLDGAQYHILTFLGHWWGQGEPRFPAEMAAGYTRHINEYGGVVSWDVPPGRDGTLDDAHRRVLGAIGGGA